jgi:hypothetical protein
LRDDEQLKVTGPDWLPILLGILDRNQKSEDVADYVEGMVFPKKQLGLRVRPGIDNGFSKIPR